MTVGSKGTRGGTFPCAICAEAGLGKTSKPPTADVLEGADFAKIAPFEKPPN